MSLPSYHIASYHKVNKDVSHMIQHVLFSFYRHANALTTLASNIKVPDESMDVQTIRGQWKLLLLLLGISAF